ncbi:MAG: hypothetical protein AAF401_02905, partial [Pseudomonadota bacterium]
KKPEKRQELMSISPQIAAMSLRKKAEDLEQDPAKKKQEDPKMQKRQAKKPRAFKRLDRGR